MRTLLTSQNILDNPEPRWPAVVALLAVGGLYEALPNFLKVGPRGLQITIVVLLLIPTFVSRRRGHHNLNRILGLLIAGINTFFMIASLALLIVSLAHHRETPVQLLMSAGALWISNVLIFALWYWHLDAGGPNARDQVSGQTAGAFLFPQMTMTAEKLKAAGQDAWSPGFVDYLFLAFNSSTALSPADTAVLGRWAKLLMMLQASISLIVVVILAARAINTLT